MGERLSFASDYMEGAHAEILRRLTETNLEQAAPVRHALHGHALRARW